VRGVGRVIVVTLINFFIVYLALALIISFIFSYFAYHHLKGIIEESITAYEMQIRTRQRGIRNETLIRELVKKFNETMYKRYGLDVPLHQRILLNTINLITYNINFTLLSGVQYPVPGENSVDVAFNAMIRTAMLFSISTLILLFFNILLGLQAAKRAGSIFDRFLAIIALITNSLPMWWVAMIMIMVFAINLKIFPVRCIGLLYELRQLQRLNLPFHEYFFRYIGIWLYYMALPIITIIIIGFGGGAYVVRSIVLVTSREDFVFVARAKGLPERRVLYRHILRAASPPIVAMIVFSIVGIFLGGAIISERVFMWPGMGTVYWTAISNGDAGVLLTLSWISVVIYLAIYFILDFVFMLLDPRIRIGKGVE